MENFLSTIIATASGGLISIITLIINNRYSFYLEKKRSKKEFYLLQEKEISEQKKQKLELLLEATEILSYLEDAISQTKSFMDMMKSVTEFEHDEIYQQELIKIHRLESIIIVYFPRLYSDVRNMTGKHNIYWGQQRIFLQIKYENNQKNWIDMNCQVIEAARNCQKCIYNLISELMLMSEEIQEVNINNASFIDDLQ
ncbi:hypothetical protein HCG69_10780 [Bacteroides sp. K03]|uniref:hypothetical protein n=1 Tax=Bacteroides sp. K03 TaxID=2718928 RepID=UPI001C8BE9EA|nr:hypothetical protein [Bacteroides sp. K03]MBX9188552.1 hypothetical protein [Bacteroides sp. K03]